MAHEVFLCVAWIIFSVSVVQERALCYAEVHDAAYHRPIKVTPKEATCGTMEGNSQFILDTPWDFGPLNKVFGKHTVVTCASGCEYMHPVKHSFQQVIPEEPAVTVGHPNCVPSVSSLDTRGHCYQDVEYDRSTQATYSLWVHPLSDHPGTIMDGGQFRIDRVGGKIVFVQGALRLTEKSWDLPRNAWTQLAIQYNLNNLETAQPAYSLFLNGTLLEMTSDQTSSPPGLTYYVRLGASQSIEQTSRGCSINEVPECRSEGHAASVSSANPASRSSPQGTYVDFQSDLNSLQRACQFYTEKTVRYVCAYFYPECSSTGISYKPCRSLCEDMKVKCRINNGSPGVNWALDCTSLPTSNCATLDAYSDQGLFYGQVKDFRIYDSLLTNREISELYTGVWPTARPLSACMCSQQYPLFDASKSQVHCWSNPPQSVRQPRLQPASQQTDNTFFFVPEFINDEYQHYHYDVPLIWVSSPALPNVSITIDFTEMHEIESMMIQLVSNPPEGAIIIEKRVGFVWSTWHYFSWDCGKLGFPAVVSKDQPYTFLQPYKPGCSDLRFVDIDFDPVIGFGRRNPPQLTWNLTLTQPGRLGNWYHDNLREFMRSEGIRVTFSGYPRRRGGPEAGLENSKKEKDINGVSTVERDVRELVHALVNIGAYGRPSSDASTQCGCFPGISCDNNKCQCPNDGQLRNEKCNPEILSVSPAYGPVSGGTELTITGSYLNAGNVGSISMGHTGCTLISVNETVIHCRTESSFLSKETGPTPLRVRLEGLEAPGSQGQSHYDMISTHSFTYKPDPVIRVITPQRTIIRGGITLTVLGDNLDSVANPFMTITMLYRGKYIQQQKQLCWVLESTTMLCPTPHINLPTEYRDLDIVSEGHSPDNHINTDTKRVKREVDTPSAENTQHGLIDNEKLQFYLYFIMDGVVSYKQDSKKIPSIYKLSVYKNPLLHQLSETPFIYVPTADAQIVIQGDYLNSGCGASDYRVDIGNGVCKVVLLTNNELHCVPPDEQPELVTDSSQATEAPSLIVHVGTTRSVVGFVRYRTSGSVWNITTTRVGIIIAILLLVVASAMLLTFCLCRRRRLKKEQQYELRRRADNTQVVYRAGPRPVAEINPRYINPRYTAVKTESRDLMDLLDDNLREKVQQCLVASERLLIHQEVGKGHFARVYSGWFKDEASDDKMLVAVKTVKNELATLENIKEFLAEATIMKDFCHENVLSLLGVIVELNHVYVIMPMMEHGNLRAFVAHADHMFTVRQLIDFGLQAARGMEYLENNGFIHRDLAARNCMVNRKHIVKIADFGLARDLFEKDYYKPEDRSCPLPVKWTALECLQGRDFSSKSDVWSYGVLMWEILTRGRKPYSDLNNSQVKAYLISGNRLEKPDYCPNGLYRLMMQCWDANHIRRPSFGDVVKRIQTIVDPGYAPSLEPGDDGYLPMEDPYVQRASNITTGDRESQNDPLLIGGDVTNGGVGEVKGGAAPEQGGQFIRNGKGEGIYDMPDDSEIMPCGVGGVEDYTTPVDVENMMRDRDSGRYNPPSLPPSPPPRLEEDRDSPPLPPPPPVPEDIVEEYTTPVDVASLRNSRVDNVYGTPPGNNSQHLADEETAIDNVIPAVDAADGLYDNNFYQNHPMQPDGYMDMRHSRGSRT